MPKRVPMGRALTIAVCASYFCRNSLAWRPVFSSGGGRHSEGSRVRIHRHHHRVARTSPSHVVQHRGGPTSSSRLSMSSEEQEALDLNEAPAGLNNPRPEVASEGLIVEDAEQRQQQQQQPWCEEELKTQGMPTLTASTQWRMFLSLKDPALGGEAGEATEVAVRVRFSEDRDFEPPQGSLEVIEDNPYFTQQAGKARWTLSEAEDERGAGLWVWGLFEDPLYPFLLLQVNNLEIELKGGVKLAPGRLYVKVDHRRDKELGPTLNSGTVGVRFVERMAVDPLGMAEADIASVVPCGTVRFRPV